MIYTTTHRSPLGQITLACDGDCLTGLWLEGQKYFESVLPAAATRSDSQPVLRTAKDWLDQYFAGARPDPSAVPLRPAGTPFRQAVWARLRDIPYGTVVSYGAIAGHMAHLLGRGSMSSQAVGGAVGHNPISILIPCHRVVGADGSLTGYAGGIDKKQKLLALEGVDLSRLSVPGQRG